MTWQGFSNPQDDVRPLKEGLDRLARQIGATSPGGLDEIAASWPDIVGAQIADHAQPVVLKKSTLVIEVDDKRWAVQMKWMSGRIVANIAQKVPGVPVEAIEVRQTPG